MQEAVKGRLYPDITKPLYLQLKDVLVDLIESGELSAENGLPAERMLAQMYDVSRVTVRKCLSVLSDEGYIVRCHGKETRIANRKNNYNQAPMVGIVEELFNNYGTDLIEVDVISKGFEVAPPSVSKQLNIIQTNNENSYAFARVINKEGRPLAINYSCVPYDIGKILDSLDLRRDKVFMFLESCGYKLGYGEQEITAHLCGEEEAQLLQYEEGQPVLVIKRTVYLEDGFPILYEKTVYRADEYQYSVRLQRKT